MRRTGKIIGIIICVLVIVAVLGFGIFIGSETFKGLTNTVSREETLENAKSYMDKYDDFVKDKEVREIKIKSSKYDYEIPAIFIKNPKGSDLAVMVHGMGGTKYSMYQQGEVLYDLGYSLLIYDQRNSGYNRCEYSTFGVLESYDCLDALDYAQKNLNENNNILLYGQSYGGATALIAASRDDSSIDYLILDCPVADLNEFVDEAFKNVERKQGLPAWIMRFTGNIFLKLRLGFSLDDIDASKWAKDSNIQSPILIINSDSDTVTPYHMGEEIYKSIGNNRKEIYTTKGYDHLEFSESNPEEFKKVLIDFLDKYK
ncbi:alpha/beta fold hydrolase [uncultured Anaerococcus sp.]|uniref:alpha/beta hydrolase n=1 Tax=uncultured Anaerococcus sp. TaxID=293428 RepID=UPI00280C05F7|nr:alpha/beta fold hydrolase [uncultured Anaerococcus sp.]MDU5149505.1 alpha/beta fold hydrolase [Anaerococcus prevotii]